MSIFLFIISVALLDQSRAYGGDVIAEFQLQTGHNKGFRRHARHALKDLSSEVQSAVATAHAQYRGSLCSNDDMKELLDFLVVRANDKTLDTFIQRISDLQRWWGPQEDDIIAYYTVVHRCFTKEQWSIFSDLNQQISCRIKSDNSAYKQLLSSQFKEHVLDSFVRKTVSGYHITAEDVNHILNTALPNQDMDNSAWSITPFFQLLSNEINNLPFKMS